MAIKRFPWDEATVAMAVAMWVNDKATTPQIAEKLGPPATRCSVIGKLWRLGLARNPKTPPKVEPIPMPKSHKSNFNPPGQLRIGSYGRPTLVPRQPAVLLNPAEEPPSLRLDIMELTHATCRWPHGDNPPFSYCGHQVEWGSRYCPHHARRAFTQAKRSA